MKFKIYSNTQNDSLKKIFPSLVFGLISYHKKHFLIKDNQFSFLENFYQKLSKKQSLNHHNISIFQSIKKSIDFFENFPLLEDQIQVHLNLSKPFHQKFHKFFIMNSSLRKSFSYSIGGIDLHQKTLFLDDQVFWKTYQSFQNSEMPIEDLSQLIFFHELGHYFDHYHVSKKNSYHQSFIQSLEYMSFLAKKSSSEFIFQDIAQKNEGCEPVCISFLSNLKKLHEELFADIFAFLSLKIFQEHSQTYQKDIFFQYLSTIAQYRQKTFESSKKELDFQLEHTHSSYSFYESLHHFTTLGIYHLRDYLPQHTISQENIIDVASFLAQKSFHSILTFLLEEDYHIEKQFKTFFIAHQQNYEEFQSILNISKKPLKPSQFSSNIFQNLLQFVNTQNIPIKSAKITI